MKYRIKKFISVKTKTITLVLSIYFILSVIFFFIRYVDISDFAKKSQSAELQKVKLVYSETLKRVRKFYITRGYANINSFGIREAFKKSDIEALHSLSLPRWNIIKKENTYLKSFSFYDRFGNLLTYFGKKVNDRLQYADRFKDSFDGFWFDKNSFYYHAVSAAKDSDKGIIGYIAFVIDPKYFLSEIKKLMNIYAYIVYEKDGRKRVFMLKNDKNMYQLIDRDKIENGVEIKMGKKIFLPYIIDGKGMDKSNSFKIIFLQDITHWKHTLKKAIVQSILAMLILVMITALIISYGFDIILKELDESNEKLRESQEKLKYLNKNLQIKIKEEIALKLKKEREANEKERLLVHQSKLASMGEMIGNIAHQWRQPLTQLSSILIGLELFYERGKLTKEKFSEKITEANEQIEFMSRTIDDFRNFFTSKKKKEYYNISYIIDNVQKLMSASLKNNGIDLTVDIVDDFKVFGFPNEISQAFLNIISNAKDIILDRGIKNGRISIKAYTDNEKNLISIEDNAGGIEVEPIDKIFEPYFSTKHAKSGTGIGLYMTKTIIEKNNSGHIEVINKKNGALFIISL